MIEVEGITKTYGQVRAVDGISFTAADGRVTGFLGPNGAGKSTTMRMIAGLERPDVVTCTVGGSSPRDLTDPIRTIGVLLDGQGGIPGLRARDYLRTVAARARISGARVDEVLEQTGLVYAALRRIRTFSLGMKQRLGIATALLGDPDHFVLDEPINGLDPEGVIWVRGLLRDLASEGIHGAPSSSPDSERRGDAPRDGRPRYCARSRSVDQPPPTFQERPRGFVSASVTSCPRYQTFLRAGTPPRRRPASHNPCPRGEPCRRT